MKFGIVIGEIEEAKELGGKIKHYLRFHGHEVLSEKLKGAEVVLTLGGDGTLIHAACEHIELNVPFVGINAGTLGFLTAAERDDWQLAVKKLVDGDYVVSERMTLEAQIVGVHPRGVQRRSQAHPGGELSSVSAQSGIEKRLGTFRAVNEVVVKGMYRVVDLEIVVNDQKFFTISGDGVIISTQTGSTAYSLSAGGPIVDPEVDCFLITPVNAVGLPIPSVALSPEDVVEVKIKSGDNISLVVDGQEHTKVEVGQSIKVVKGRFRVKFGYFDKHHFLKALNAKFGLASRLVK